MHPLAPLFGAWLLAKAQPGKNQDLVAYAVPSMGWLVVTLPWDTLIVIGNTYAFNTNLQVYYYKRFGTDAEAQTGLDQFKQFSAGSLRPMPAREPARARWYASPKLISAKWRQFVWALDERDTIGTVDKGHFLGKALQGTAEKASAVIIAILQQQGANLDPLISATVGHGPRCRTAWR